jgi:hypothetical protein
MQHVEEMRNWPYLEKLERDLDADWKILLNRMLE